MIAITYIFRPKLSQTNNKHATQPIISSKKDTENNAALKNKELKFITRRLLYFYFLQIKSCTLVGECK